MTTYRFTSSSGSFLLRANFAASASQIESNFNPNDEDDDESWTPTGLQVADARHSPTKAARLVLASCGRDWYADPSDGRDDDVVIDEVMRASRLIPAD